MGSLPRRLDPAAAKVADYEHGWSADIETDFAPKGLNEDTVRFISAKKNEPDFMLEYRLKAFEYWKTLKLPDWAHLDIPEIDYQDIIYYAAPKQKVTDLINIMYEENPYNLFKNGN